MAKIDKKSSSVNPISVDNGAGANMIVSTPKSFGDIQSLIASLREGQSVIFKLDGVSVETAQRMVDFMAGAAFALGGSMQRIEKNMYLVTRAGMGIMFQE